MNPLENVTTAVDGLVDATPALLEACTDPQALDMAELLFVIREARTKLYDLERDVQHALARAMVDDLVTTPDLWVERKRSADRKSWDHESWQRDVRQQALRKAGLLGATVISADGEELPAGAVAQVLREVQSVHGAAGPKVSKDAGLRAFGLDPGDYCETSPGGVTVTVRRMADETPQAGEPDAA